MVPKMQGDVLDAVLKAKPDIHHICDPFVGAGTTLTETMMRGRTFSGFDINPLAVLVCQAKSSMFRSVELREKAQAVLDRCDADSASTIDVTFPGREKWFSKQAAIQLSRIRRAIQAERAAWARKVMWVVLAETIRQTCNSRTSTYKLHIRPPDELSKLADPLSVFRMELLEAVGRFVYHEGIFQEKGLLKCGRYAGKTSLYCQDIRNAPAGDSHGQYDLVITSPPYGDNRSTVSYGQFSYLALSWIPTDELPGPSTLFSNAYSTDKSSLGGSAGNASHKASVMRSVSSVFAQYHKSLATLQRKELEAKVAAFAYDFFEAITVIVGQMRSGGYLVWTLGDRTVGGIPVPFVDICQELQENLGLQHVASFRRIIPSKRTPSRNSVSDTMGSECLLIMRRP